MSEVPATIYSNYCLLFRTAAAVVVAATVVIAEQAAVAAAFRTPGRS
jgi:hypothetical protein